jgi:hypothetical protein
MKHLASLAFGAVVAVGTLVSAGGSQSKRPPAAPIVSATASVRAASPAPEAQGSSLASMSAGFDSGTAFKMVAFPPRNETFAFRQTLESVYQTQLRRTATSTFVDLEGDIVWTQEYLRYRVSGCSHDAAVQSVLTEIDGRAGPADCGGSVSFPPRNEPFDFRSNAL